MTAPILAAALLCLVLTAVQLVSLTISIGRLYRKTVQQRPGTHYPMVSLIRPLCGLDNYAADTIADSNVLMPADYIQHLFASWQADTGLVASPPIGSRPQGFWAEIECTFLNTYQARWQY